VFGRRLRICTWRTPMLGQPFDFVQDSERVANEV
jgi:hypothetical protein